jgi:hypothetical protein
MVTLVKETGAGLTNSNSYANVSDGDTYHDMRLHVDDWTGASTSDKEKALMWATRLLDDLVEWEGRATSDEQALDWPRYSIYDDDGYYVNGNTVPQAIIDATSELARNLLEEDITASPDTLGFSYIRAGDVAVNIDKRDRDSVFVISDIVTAMLKPYGTVNPRVAMEATLVRT